MQRRTLTPPAAREASLHGRSKGPANAARPGQGSANSSRSPARTCPPPRLLALPRHSPAHQLQVSAASPGTAPWYPRGCHVLRLTLQLTAATLALSRPPLNSSPFNLHSHLQASVRKAPALAMGHGFKHPDMTLSFPQSTQTKETLECFFLVRMTDAEHLLCGSSVLSALHTLLY